MRKLEEYLTVGQAAELLGVSRWTLRYWDRTGKLSPARHPMSGYRLYLRDQLDEILARVAGHAPRGIKPFVPMTTKPRAASSVPAKS